MRRMHLVEIEDQSWCPRSLRDALTDYLCFVLEHFAPYAQTAPLLGRTLERLGETRIVDLCSGGGGPWPDLVRRLRAGRPALRVRLTDYFPNREAFARLREQTRGALEGWNQPVDAGAVPAELEGFRTLFTSFHHFRPAAARRVLTDAVRQRRGIAIFEATSRSVLALVGMPFFALGVLIFTPFIRPFRWSRLFWTYLVPVLPLVIWVDATVSCLRTYTQAELRRMTDELGARDYAWDIGTVRAGRLPFSLSYLIGYPLGGTAGHREVS
jgi:hypothetical protein